MTAPSPSSDRAGTAAASRAASLRSRLGVTVVIVSIFTALAAADATGFAGASPSQWLLPVALALAVGGADELIRLAGRGGLGLRGGLVGCATAAIVLSAAGNGPALAGAAPRAGALGWTAFATVAACGGLLLAEVARYRPQGRGLERFVTGMGIACCLGLPFAFLVALRLLGVGLPIAASDPAEADGRMGLSGMLPLVSLIAVVKAGDIAAYAVGSLVGRHRMAPLVSPGKTWEGAAASLAAAIGIAWCLFERVDWGTAARPWGGWLTFGLLVGLAGMAGDLAESLVKRELGAKDSGHSLGGLGGVLDLVDSLLLAAPLAWLLWVA